MLNPIKHGRIALTNISSRIKFPQKFKGTIIEKWVDYWKNLAIDYRQMLQDLRSDMQDDPRKALLWSTGLATTYYMACNNPSDTDFKDNLRTVTNEVILISESCCNPKSIDHLRYLEKCYNENNIHYANLGIASIMYVSNYSDDCNLYRAQCSYLKPTYFNFPTRIVDVGFLGKWWNIYIKTCNYDIKSN